MGNSSIDWRGLPRRWENSAILAPGWAILRLQRVAWVAPAGAGDVRRLKHLGAEPMNEQDNPNLRNILVHASAAIDGEIPHLH